jgi:hypothetical protein
VGSARGSDALRPLPPRPEPAPLTTAAAARRPQIIIADRSPLSAVFYARSGGALLEPLIRSCIEELAGAAGVHVLAAHVRTPRALLWSRILARLALEPHRMALNEDRCVG